MAREKKPVHKVVMTQASNPPPWIVSLFVRYSKKHEKTSSFLEEVELSWIRQLIMFAVQTG